MKEAICLQAVHNVVLKEGALLHHRAGVRNGGGVA